MAGELFESARGLAQSRTLRGGCGCTRPGVGFEGGVEAEDRPRGLIGPMLRPGELFESARGLTQFRTLRGCGPAIPRAGRRQLQGCGCARQGVGFGKARARIRPGLFRGLPCNWDSDQQHARRCRNQRPFSRIPCGTSPSAACRWECRRERKPSR